MNNFQENDRVEYIGPELRPGVWIGRKGTVLSAHPETGTGLVKWDPIVPEPECFMAMSGVYLTSIRRVIDEPTPDQDFSNVKV